MRRSISRLLILAWLALPAAASAASISGMLLYATDDFGDPYGYSNFDNCGNVQTQLWRTVLGSVYYGLGIWDGLPPQSLGRPPLNAPNFMVDIPLADGENDFTLLGEPGPHTESDQEYVKFSINLYFDGLLDQPGLSVLFPRHNAPAGSPVEPNRAKTCRAYSLSLNPVNADTPASYDDGLVKVSVLAASFLPAQSFGADVDMVSANRLIKSGIPDFIGVLKVMVEPSDGGAGAAQGGGPVAGPGPQGFGGLQSGRATGGGGYAGPGMVAPSAPDGGGYGAPEPQHGTSPNREAWGGWRQGQDAQTAEAETTPAHTPAGTTPTPGGRTGTPTVAAENTTVPTAGAGTTPTPRPTSVGATPTAGKVESTPAASAAATSPRPAATPTAARASKKP